MRLGSMPPMVNWSPLIPPWGFRGRAGRTGYGKLNGFVFEVPRAKIGAGDALLAWKVGKMLPGGLPRYCSWRLASVGQLGKKPAPALITHEPLPVGSHARPPRGLNTSVMERLS